jgi:hypothetical protein
VWAVAESLISIMSSFSSVSTQHFLAGSLSRSDPVDLTLLISLWMLVVLGTDPRKFMTKFSLTLSSVITFHV